jgi:hypothetical protein
MMVTDFMRPQQLLELLSKPMSVSRKREFFGRSAWYLISP